MSQNLSSSNVCKQLRPKLMLEASHYVTLELSLSIEPPQTGYSFSGHPKNTILGCSNIISNRPF